MGFTQVDILVGLETLVLGCHNETYPGREFVVPESNTLSPIQILTSLPASTVGAGVIVVLIRIGSDSQPY